jgi:carbonic anhydrase
MDKKIKYLGAIIALAGTLTISQANEEGNHAKHWGYLGESSPAHWGDISSDFKMCKEGKQQSPINIVPTKDTNLTPLDLNYTAGAKSIINNGHSIQVNMQDGNTLKLDGKVYKLKQFHFHVPSENNIKGDKFPLEAHFVHVADDGKIAVIGVMFVEDKENPVLKKAWSKLPKLEIGKEDKCGLSVDEVKSLMPKNKDYYRFKGSLTTPPCSEGVDWIVYKEPLSVSREQVNSFFNTFSFPNNRPVQPANKREIQE